MKTGSDKKYIIKENAGDIDWYVCGLSYYDNPDSDWILGPTVAQAIEKAMQFCEEKAKKIAEILTNQVDEEGYSCKHEIVEAEVQTKVVEVQKEGEV